MSWEKCLQPRAAGFLKNTISKGNTSHAYLFTGPEGIGKGLLAVETAKALLCGDSGEACDACRSCRLIDDGGHPDVQRIAPGGKQIKVEAVRRLQHEISLKPVEGQRKVAIIEEADLLNPASGNALLKLLEEPPDRTFFLLTSSRPQAVLSTIRSRCQEVRLAPVPLEAMRRMLTAEGFPKEQALFLARLTGGVPGLARRLAALEGFWDVRTAVEDLFETLGDLDYSELLSRAEYLAAADPAAVFLLIDHSCRKALRPAAARRMMAAAAEARRALESNVNRGLVFEVLLIRLQRVFRQSIIVE